LALAVDDLAQRRYPEAVASAAAADAAILAALPDDYQARAQALTIGGVARLVPTPRNAEDVKVAMTAFESAAKLFPPQADIDSFDPLLAQALAWRGAAGAAWANLGEEGWPGDCTLATCVLYSFTQPSPPADVCEVDWVKKTAPDYPKTGLRKGYIGAVIVGFRLGDDMAVHDERVLAEVPTAEFGAAALKSMKAWRLAHPPSNLLGCRDNYITMFSFQIMD
jgi:hypothetical protein